MDRQQASSLLACAISLRVDIYKLVQPEDSEETPDEIKPASQIFKFKDVISSVEFRPDGNLLLVGESSGRVQLFETQNKYVLRTYEEHQGRINNLCFSSNNRNFLSVANETSVRLWDIQDSSAHSVASI